MCICICELLLVHLIVSASPLSMNDVCSYMCALKCTYVLECIWTTMFIGACFDSDYEQTQTRRCLTPPIVYINARRVILVHAHLFMRYSPAN